MKYKIEKNTVQETLIIPLYARKKCSEIFPSLFQDEAAAQIIDRVEYDFSDLEDKSRSTIHRFGFLEVAMRQYDLAFEVKDYLRDHPRASVVNLGCGLDNTGRACDNGTCRIYNIDFPDVIHMRNDLLPPGEREENLAYDIRDTSWIDRVPTEEGVVLFASGVFYYFLADQVKSLVGAMAGSFKGGRLVFDAAGRLAVKLMLKTWIKDAKIKDVGAYFSVNQATSELSSWAENIRVSSRPYMLGYHDLRDPSVGSFFRILSKLGDGIMKMQIVRVDFL